MPLGTLSSLTAPIFPWIRHSGLYNFIRVISVKWKLSLLTVPGCPLGMSSWSTAKYLRSKRPSVFRREIQLELPSLLQIGQLWSTIEKSISQPSMSLLNQCMFSGFNNTISTLPPPWQSMLLHPPAWKGTNIPWLAVNTHGFKPGSQACLLIKKSWTKAHLIHFPLC